MREAKPLVRDVLLRDGSTLRLRSAAPADFDDIKQFFDGLSPEARLMRFHGYGRTDAAARAASEARGPDRCSLIAHHDGRVVAVAGFDGLREPTVAEVAFAVADDFQHRGAGTRMLEQLAEVAATRGITRFSAEVMSENRAMLDVFEGAGFGIRRRVWQGEVTVSLDITPADAVALAIDDRDHRGAVASLRPLLAPSVIAVAGAATEPGNVGQIVVDNLVASGYRGAVVPVNRAGGIVCSRPAARTLAELHDPPHLVIIAASGDEAEEFAIEAGEVGAKALLVLTGDRDGDGMASIGWAERLLEIARSSGLRLVGPSALGVINTAPDVRLNATFSGARIRPGALAIGAEAIAPGVGLLAHAEARGIGISTLISIGANVDVSTNDLLEWCEDDEHTAAVMLYLESFGDPHRFTRVAQRLSRRKPILLVKGRRSAERARAEARSDTLAALHGDAIVDAVLEKAGILRFHNGEELFQIAQYFESQPLPQGERLAIVSNSSSVATLAGDACATHGLEVRDERGAPYPVVLGLSAAASEYATRVRELLAESAVDAVIACYVDHLHGDAASVLEAISEVARAQDKPVVACVVQSDGRLPTRTNRLVPNYAFPESGVAVLARAAARRKWLSRPLGVPPDYDDIDDEAARRLTSAMADRDSSDGWLSPVDAEALVRTHGLPIVHAHRCSELDAVLAAQREVAGPVVLKADVPMPMQPSDLDAVMPGLEDPDALRAAWDALERLVRTRGAAWRGAIVQRLVDPGADLLVGAFTDPDLGTVISLGLGGRQAGLGQTLACRRPPVTDVDADEMIDSSLAVTTALRGLRGGPPLRRPALRELILRFSILLRNVPDIVEADLNPVRCTTQSAVVLGMRIRIERRSPPNRVKTW